MLEGADGVEPVGFIGGKEGSEFGEDGLVVGLEPGALAGIELGVVDEAVIEGNVGEGLEAVPGGLGFGVGIVFRREGFDHVEVFNADAAPAGFVVARFDAGDHAGFQGFADSFADAVWPFVDVEECANAVASAVAVVEASVPEGGAGDAVELCARGAFGEFLHGAVDVGFEDFGVAIALFWGGGADRDRAGVIGGAGSVLSAGVEEEQIPRSQLGLGVWGAVVDDGTVGPGTCDGVEAETLEVGFGGVVLLNGVGNIGFGDGVALGELIPNPFDGAGFGAAGFEVCRLHLLNFGGVFPRFHALNRVGGFHNLAAIAARLIFEQLHRAHCGVFGIKQDAAGGGEKTSQRGAIVVIG